MTLQQPIPVPFAHRKPRKAAKKGSGKLDSGFIGQTKYGKVSGTVDSSTTEACFSTSQNNLIFVVSGIIGPSVTITLDGKEFGTFVGSVVQK